MRKDRNTLMIYVNDQLKEYVDKVVAEETTTISTFLRNLIEKDMKERNGRKSNGRQ